jgi:hypothetical protein
MPRDPGSSDIAGATCLDVPLEAPNNAKVAPGSSGELIGVARVESDELAGDSAGALERHSQVFEALRDPSVICHDRTSLRPAAAAERNQRPVRRTTG